MHLTSNAVGKGQIPLWERPLGFRRIPAAWSQFRPSQRGPNPPPVGSDALSLGPWPAYFILVALEQVLQEQHGPSSGWWTLETFCPLHRSKNTFSSKKKDWFGTKTAAPHPSNSSLKLYPIYAFIPVLDLLPLRWSKVLQVVLRFKDFFRWKKLKSPNFFT